jgi:hypothetical protein
MRKLLFFLLPVIAMQARGQNPGAQQPYLTQNFGKEAVRNIRVETTGGNISVQGVDEGTRIEVYVWAGNKKSSEYSKEAIKKRIDEDYDLNISVVNNQLIATAKPKKKNGNWNSTLSISFKVFTSRNVSSKLVTSGGNISLSDLEEGMQDFTTSGGNLEISHVGGTIDGVTSGGNISVTDAKAEVELTTSGGNINATNCEGEQKLSTSGGSLHLSRLKGKIKAVTSGGDVQGDQVSGELFASTSGGNIDLSNISGSLESATSGGNIRVSMKTTDKYLTLSNSGGNIDLQLPAGKGYDLKLQADRIRTSTLTNFSGDVEDHSIKGKLNGGGIPVTVHANSGSINLTFL